LVARPLATAALSSNSDIPQNPKWATKEKEWPTHSSPQKIYKKCKIHVETENFCTKPELIYEEKLFEQFFEDLSLSIAKL
jgi:hypothetical protein